MEKININQKKLASIISEAIKKAINNIANNNAFKISDYFDLKKLPINKLFDKIYDLSIIVRGNGFGSNLSVEGEDVLNEEAERTLSFEETKKELIKNLHFETWQIKSDNGANGIKLIVLFVDYGINEDVVLKEMAACGWSKSYVSETTIDSRKKLKAISFDPMFQDNVNVEIAKYGYMFHWTPSKNIENIQKNGLLPKSENRYFMYPQRVHLLKPTVTEEEAIHLVKELYKKSDKTKGSNYALLYINVKNLLNNVEFYYDPRYEFGYYSKEPIPFEVIKIIGYFDVLKDTKINYL